ncbi:hypothetical protein [uncultured Endozoicomonas sp.]|uniref:hypothetical protein n=1 Tax=uncultured Endozoicomonas sp. TaxID=432652 RepID=UPI00260CC371|nr:hypothetical protein [uncultured Endozoicomonas sp.]
MQSVNNQPSNFCANFLMTATGTVAVAALGYTVGPWVGAAKLLPFAGALIGGAAGHFTAKALNTREASVENSEKSYTSIYEGQTNAEATDGNVSEADSRRSSIDEKQTKAGTTDDSSSEACSMRSSITEGTDSRRTSIEDSPDVEAADNRLNTLRQRAGIELETEIPADSEPASPPTTKPDHVSPDANKGKTE